jgi:hypothetical protein
MKFSVSITNDAPRGLTIIESDGNSECRHTQSNRLK